MANQFNGVWKIFSIIVLEDMNFSMKKYESLTILHKSLALSAHASPQTIHFQVLDQSPVSGPGRGPPSCNKWQLWRGLFFTETDILTTWGTRASLPANGPDPAAATGTLLSLVSSWRGQLARVPRPVRNKRLYWSLSPSLSVSSP